jgi:hypothetical protein
MASERLNRLTGRMVLVLSLIALFTVLTGYFQAPLPDEGTAAHIFQLAILACLLSGVVFLASADWKQPARIVRPLAVPTVALTLAFAALFYLEYVFYPAHYR